MLTNRAQNFHEHEAREVDLNFLMFSAAKASESSTFALGPTTGTGNEKRRALRKSSERGTICHEKVYERGTIFVKNCIKE